MRKVLYTKFSRERRNEFQIMTRITEEDGIRRVWKLPLQKEGELHIRHMYENYRKLEHLYTYAGVQICPCELDEEKCALAFPFVEGESLETRISRHGKEKDFAGAWLRVRGLFPRKFYKTRKKGVVSDDHWNRPWVLCHENKTGVFPDRTDAIHL